MWLHNIDPVLFELGPLEIRYYGLAYLIGALLAYWMLERARRKGLLPLNEKEVSDLVVWLIVGVIVGSRLFFVLFYNFSDYLSQPWWKVFAVWEGGMSFHGGLTGIVLAGYFFCRWKKLNMLQVADVLSAPLMLALALGRIANFINGELWGTVSDARWCVNFRNTGGGDSCRHPYQLYEMLKRFAIFGWLLFLGKGMFSPGFVFWNFVFFEGIGRFFLDVVKDDAAYWGLTAGQWMSIIMVCVAAYFFWTRHREDWKKIFS